MKNEFTGLKIDKKAAPEAINRALSVEFKYPNDDAYEEDKIKVMAEAFNSVFGWIWLVNGNSRQPKAAFSHFVVFTALVRPDLIGKESYEKIADKMDLTKANLSLIAKDFEREFGMKFGRSHNK